MPDRFTPIMIPYRTEPIALYRQFAKKYGLTVSQIRVLEAVCLRRGCTQKTLCDTLQTSKQRVNLLVRELTQKKMLLQSENEKDGRSRLLYLTEEGDAAAADLLSAMKREAGLPAAQEMHTHVLEDGTVITHVHGEEHGRPHSHPHAKAVTDRLARAAGHLEKVRQMVEDGADCSEVLIQLSAVNAAISNAGKLILKDHIAHCLVDAAEHGDRRTLEELDKAIDRFIK